jgi:serine/threonine protein kinase
MINKAIFSLEIYSNKYSKQFLDIVKLCLEYDPANRPNPDEVFTLLEELKNNSKNNVFCIRLEAEENKEKPE